MKKSAKILLLVLVLALVCAALVIGAFAAVAQGEDGVKVMASMDFQGLTVGTTYSGADVASSSSSDAPSKNVGLNGGGALTGVNNAIIAVQGRHGTYAVENGGLNGENVYITLAPSAKHTDTTYNGTPYFSLSFSGGRPELSGHESHKYQVVDLDVSLPTGTAMNSLRLAFLNRIDLTASSKDAQLERGGSIGMKIFSNAADVAYVAGYSKETGNTAIDRNGAWTHVTYIMETIDTWVNGETGDIYYSEESATEAGVANPIPTLDYYFYIAVNDVIVSSFYYGNSYSDTVMKPSSSSYTMADIVGGYRGAYVFDVQLQWADVDHDTYEVEEKVAIDNFTWRSINPSEYDDTKEGQLVSALAAAREAQEAAGTSKTISVALDGWEGSLYDEANMPFGKKIATLTRGDAEIGVYDNLQDAVDAAQHGDTITIHNNSTYSASNLDARITIDTQGYSVGTLSCVTGFTTEVIDNIINVKNASKKVAYNDFEGVAFAEGATEKALSTSSNTSFGNKVIFVPNSANGAGKVTYTGERANDTNKYFQYAWAQESGTSNHPYIYLTATEGSSSAATSYSENFLNKPWQVLEFDLFTPTGKTVSSDSFIQFLFAYYKVGKDGTSAYSSFFTSSKYNSIGLKYDEAKGQSYLSSSHSTYSANKYYLDSNAWSHITVALETTPRYYDDGSFRGYWIYLHLFVNGEYIGKMAGGGISDTDMTDERDPSALFLRQIKIQFTKKTDADAPKDAQVAFDNFNFRTYYTSDIALTEIINNNQNLTEWVNTIYTTDYVMPFGNAVIEDASGKKYDGSMIEEAIAADKASNGAGLTVVKDFKYEFNPDYETTITFFDPSYTNVTVTTECPWVLFNDNGVYTTKHANIVYERTDGTYWYTKDQDEGDFQTVLETMYLTPKKTGTITLYDYDPTFAISEDKVSWYNVTINLNGNTLTVTSEIYNAGQIKVRDGKTFKIMNGDLIIKRDDNESAHYPLFGFSGEKGGRFVFDNVRSYSSGLVYNFKNQGTCYVDFIGGEHHIVRKSTIATEGGIVDSRSNIVVTANGTSFYSDSDHSAAPFHLSNKNGIDNYGGEANPDYKAENTLSFTNCNFYMETETKQIFTMNEFTTVTLTGCYVEGALDPTKSTGRDNSTDIGDPKDGSIILGVGTTLSSKANTTLSSKVAFADGVGKFYAPDTTIKYNLYSNDGEGNVIITPTDVEFTPQFTVKLITDAVFNFTKGAYMIYADESTPLSLVIELTSKNGEIIFLRDVHVMTKPESEVETYVVDGKTHYHPYTSINKGMTINLNGYTLYFSQSHKESSYIRVATTDEVTVKGGTIIWSINENALSSPEAWHPDRGAHVLFYISRDNATLNFRDLNTVGVALAYSNSSTGTTVNVDGGNYHITRHLWLNKSALFDFRANSTININNATITLDNYAYLLTLTSYNEEGETKKNTAIFNNCTIIAKSASSLILDDMNEYTTMEFNACQIYGSINPQVHTNDYSEKGIQGPKNDSILLGKGTVLMADATVNMDIIKIVGGYDLVSVSTPYTIYCNTVKGDMFDFYNSTLTVSPGTKNITFTLEVKEPVVTKYTVTWYNELGTGIVHVSYAEYGEVVIPPSYTPSTGNGWYKTGFDGWARTFGSTVKETDFTITEDTSFWPAQTENQDPQPYLSGAQYNLSFTGSVMLNFYLPNTPENVTNVRVYPVDENGEAVESSPLSYVGIWVTRGGEKVYYRVYEVVNLSPIELAENTKIKVYFDVEINGGKRTLIQTVTLSPLRYATNILKDSEKAEPSWDSSTHTMIADMVRYANYLSIAAKNTDVPALTELLDSYEKICSPLPSNNDFNQITTSIYGLQDYLTEITFAIDDFSPKWVIGVKESAKVVDIAISVNGYLPITNKETGINFGNVEYAIDEDKSTFVGNYITTAYFENMPVYNMDRLITITVTTEDGVTASATYSLNAYYNGMNVSGDDLVRYQNFLKAFRAFGNSSASYKYPTVKGETVTSQDPLTCNHESAMSKSNTGLNEGKLCDTCQNYVFFYNDFIEEKSGTVYTSRDDAMVGKSNSFGSIEACHAAANAKSFAGYNAICVAAPGAYYYIQRPAYDINADNTIAIYTNTSWSGAYIISDESEITHTDAEFGEPLFTVKGNDAIVGDTTYSANGTNIKGYLTSGVSKGTTKFTGFTPGIPMMVKLVDKSVKHYIRTGNNADNGQDQTEVILIDEFGNVSSSTPIEWTYTYSSNFSATAYPINYSPITISGLDANGNITATYENIANSYIISDKFRSVGRGVSVERSNVTVEGLYHILTEETGDGTFRQSYSFMSSRLATNVTFKDMSVWHHKGRTADDGSSIGSYEFTSRDSINVSWINCKQRNFFYSDSGKLYYSGVFGTNTTRNMYLRDCFLHSFDAHTAAYNVTIENSTFEHLNFIGAGDVRLTNVTIYLVTSGGILLRSDYGSRWEGNFYLDGVEFRYDTQNFSSTYVDLIKAAYKNSYYGYNGVNARPTEIHVNNVSIKQYTRAANANTYEFDEEGRLVETSLSNSTKKLALYYELYQDIRYLSYDLTSSNSSNSNPMKCTEAIYITNSNVQIQYPQHKFFKNMQVYIDGDLQNWYK